MLDSQAQERTLPSPDELADSIRSRLADPKARPMEAAKQAVLTYPADGTLLLLAAYTGIV